MRFISKMILVGGLAATAMFAITACTQPQGGSASGGSPDTPKSVEVMIFKGGYGSDFFEKAAEEFTTNTGIKVSVIADPRIDQQALKRFQVGDPPDLAYPGWRFDAWKAVQDGEVMDLTAAMKEPVFGGGSGTWGGSFEPGILKLGENGGKQMLMPYFYSLWGWWYDPDLFAEKGWKVPKTYQELLLLCQQIKGSGMAPITYQGQYPDYMTSGMLQPWIISAGGMDAMKACQNLEPGAWKSPAVIKSASMIRELRDMGYFQMGATALSHTEAQAEFINRRAALIPCGTWLYSEMKDSLPEGRRMQFMLPPVLSDGKGDPTAITVKIEPWLIAEKSTSKKEAVEFFKYLTSLEKAKQFVVEKGTLMSIKGSDEVDLPEYLKGAADSMKASKAPWSAQWKEWYPTFYKAVGDALTELVNGELSPQEFANKCEAEAEKLRKNDDIAKHKVE
ncbi:MAG: extracellular solute-binding protein [Fimbriimonadaceae bacterium]|nr:MAG: extracellular solute-binding protein [Fimbriimonadaceae bacterium]